METSLTIISIMVAIIGVLVTFNVVYNFVSIHDFHKRLKKLEDDNKKINDELIHYKYERKVLVEILYHIHTANARFSFNDKHYFEAIVHELKNIYHITNHKSEYSDFEFNQKIGVKYHFIAQDTLKYNEDFNKNSTNNDDRNKLIEFRNDIVKLCSSIRQHPNALDIDTKLRPIERIVPTLIDDLYYNKTINPYGGDWEIIRKLSK